MHQTTDLTPARQALLAKWVRTGTGGDAEITATTLADDQVPLSFVQERQLFLEALDPGTAVNNLAVCLHLHGIVDLQRLEQGANLTVARHDTLRTSFDLSLGRPVARVVAEARVHIEVTDLDDPWTDDDSLARALQLAEAEARQPFNLGRAPLVRARAVRIAPNDCVLVIVVHHTVSDGWSLGVLLRELFAAYDHLATDPAWRPEPLPIQYGDFATWQRHPQRAPALAEQQRFWREQLRGELPVLELPIDHPRPARQTLGGATHRLTLPGPLARGLRELGRQCDATPFMVLMAGYQALLQRYGGHDDVLVGTPSAGRSRPETHPLIGAFINTLVLRTDLSGNPTFRELVGRVRDGALAAYAHQDLPFEQLVAELRPPRDLSRTPVFQALFIMQNSPLPDLAIPGLSVDLIHLDRGAAQFDLTLMVSESPQGLETAFEYNCDLFEAATIKRLARAYLLLLEAAVARPETNLSALPLMTAAERHDLLVTGNDTTQEYPRDLGVHQLIEAQARRTPDRIAVTCGGAEFTYRELDRRADRLADELQARGVGAGERVGVCLERSPDLIVALLAVLKAGGAYVPIDPAMPADRVRQLLRDAGAMAVFACDAFEPPTGIGRLQVTRPEELPPPRAGSAATRRRHAVKADQLAYVIFTSGSTGQPKGVLVNQAGLVNLLISLAQLLELGPDDALLALTSISFDIAALELFLPLCVGARVILTTRDEARDPRRLQRAIAEHGVTVVQATPSLWRLILEGGWQGAPTLLALSGGEPLTVDLASRILERTGRLWNLYGPTETTVWSAAGPIQRGQRVITIGQPIANTRLYVLDPSGEPSPIGAIGELYIGGAGVARGYLDQPALTAEKFVPPPPGLPEPPGTRLFRSGDRARIRTDGKIEVLGRLDHQVKLHGFRIEPGEIEAALAMHPVIRESIVVVRDTAGGDRHLVAYIVLDGAREPTAAELREFLRATLPAHLVPALFIPLPRLPLSVSGKVDRSALPPPPAFAGGPTITASRTPLEARLVDLVAQVLGIPEVGVHDNFFDLGGGSIQILELVVRAQTEGVTLLPEWFFEHQTMAELAAFIGHDAARAAVAASCEDV